jgi:NAD(P)-dependent dehydrogenase (short-subunit alcohol dehydrogenase family)
MGLLENKVAFITGGASGIGAGMARRFAEEGASIAIADVTREREEQLGSELQAVGRQVLFLECNVSKPDDVQRAIAATVEQFGKLDIVCANAGINGMWAPVEEIEPDEWDRTIDVNLKGTFLTVHYAVPYLKKNGGGSIIITSSVNGTRMFSMPGGSAYSTSKGGQVAFMKMMAVELGRHNIRCNAICPGLINTNIEENTERRHVDKIDIKIKYPTGIPAVQHGMGEPADVADVCLFLASDESRFVSGVEIYVDGAASMLG